MISGKKSGGGGFAPVIEYRGVCILEKSGDVRAIWNGQEYRTDGRAYIFVHRYKNAFEVLCLRNEKDAKDILDHFLIDKRILQLESERLRLLSWKECVQVLCKDDPAEIKKLLKAGPCRHWDKEAQIFVREGERTPFIRDGQHRHSGF